MHFYISLKLYGLVIYISTYLLFWYNILYCFLIYPYVVVSICINLANIPLLCILRSMPTPPWSSLVPKLQCTSNYKVLYAHQVCPEIQEVRSPHVFWFAELVLTGLCFQNREFPARPLFSPEWYCSGGQGSKYSKASLYAIIVSRKKHSLDRNSLDRGQCYLL